MTIMSFSKNLKSFERLGAANVFANLMSKFGLKKPATNSAGNGNNGGKSGGAAGLHPKQIRLKELQREFQKDDGLPVHLKLPRDRMLHKVTWLLCGLGMLGNLKVYFDLAKPK